MAFPQTRRVIVVELFINGGWVDISSDVYVRNSIVIKRGRADEQGRAAPSSCQLTIDNRSGNYSPRNPMGLYYGSLGRNTPIRVSVELASDTFTRTVSSGWGTSDSGATYTTESIGSPTLASNWNVDGSRGTFSIPGANKTRTCILNGISLTDADVSCFATLPFNLPTGAGIMHFVQLRRQSVTDYVRAWAQIQTDGSVLAGVTHVDGTILVAQVTVSGLTFSAAVGLNIRGQVEGQTWRVKVWPGTDSEPYAWTITGNSTYRMAPGGVGASTWVRSGNTNTIPILSSIDNLHVRVPRFCGEVSSWPQRWDLSGEDVYVQVEGAGIKRRLVQQAPLQSPLRRFHDQLALPPVDYWPCEDLKSSQYCANVEDDVPLVPLDGDNGNFPVGFSTSNLNDAWISFSDYSAYPGSAPIVTLPQRGEIVASGAPAGTPPSPLSLLLSPMDPAIRAWDVPWSPSGQVMHRFLMTITHGPTEPQDTIGGNPVGTPMFTVFIGGSIFQITYWTGGFVAVEGNFPVYSNGPYAIRAPDGQGRDLRDRDFLYSLQLTASGSNTLYSLTFLEVGAVFSTAISGTLTGVTMNSADIVYVGIDGLPDYHVGHVSTRLENVAVAGEIFPPLNAWSGPYKETAGARFSRLCTEEAIAWYYRGDLAQTPLMGPQGSGSVTSGTSNNASLTQINATQTLLDLLYEVEDVDLGMFYEPRGDLGLEYRTRRDLYSQTPALTLDYSLRQVAPPLEPVDDDQKTRNNIVVSQPNGLSAEAELTAGSMSTLDPSSGGVGNYNVQYTINTTVEQLADLATFLLSLGTVDEARYPSITVKLADLNIVTAGIESPALAVNIGDLITVTNPKTGVTFDTIRQIVQGYVETLNVFEHTITFNTSPESPYRLAQVSATPAFKVDTDTSTLVSGVSSSTTTLTVANVNEPWTTDPTQMPIPITVAGELMNVTAISGSSSPQTFTVTRSVNDVIKAQTAGASVQIAQPQRPFIAF